jgi:hypothetical protein
VSGLLPQINIFIVMKMYRVWFYSTFVDASAYARCVAQNAEQMVVSVVEQLYHPCMSKTNCL